MADALGRVQDGAALQPGGPAWQTNDAAFSNPTGRLNLVTNPVAGFRVAPDAGNRRNQVTVLPNGLVRLPPVPNANISVGIDPGNIILYTVPAGLNLEVKSVFLRCTTATAITAPARVGVGVAPFDPIVYQDQILTGFTATGLTYRFPTGGKTAILGPGDVLRLIIITSAAGTTQLVTVEVYGRLFE